MGGDVSSAFGLRGAVRLAGVFGLKGLVFLAFGASVRLWCGWNVGHG